MAGVSPTRVRWATRSVSPSTKTFNLSGSGTGSYARQVLRHGIRGRSLGRGVVWSGRQAVLVHRGAEHVHALGGRFQLDGPVRGPVQRGPRSIARSGARTGSAGTDTAITKPVNSAELSCYDPAQVSVGGGNLRLRAVARPCRANNGITYAYASGLVESAHDFTFTFGRLEARIWVPPGSGSVGTGLRSGPTGPGLADDRRDRRDGRASRSARAGTSTRRAAAPAAARPGRTRAVGTRSQPTGGRDP